MSRTPTNFLTATETQALVRSGKVSVTQVLSDHVGRYKDRNGQVGAWVHVKHDEGVMGGEEDVDRPLYGVTLGVKDIMDTNDMPTEHGCQIYKGAQAGVDAAVVGICRQAGAAIIGKTTTTMFAASNIGPETHNPSAPGRTPGGSSSGSVAAVADFQCHIALGTQTGGSIIRPASFTGIFGFKPTYGTICKDGVKSNAGTFDTIGFFARSITDIQLISREFDIISSYPSPPYPKSLGECRFAFIGTDQFEPHGTDDLKTAWSRAQSLLSSTGAKVEEVDLPSDFDNLVGAEGRLFMDLTLAEAYTNFLREHRKDRSKLDPELQDWVENKRVHSPRRQAEMRDRIAALRPVFDGLAGGYDAIITPSAPGEAPRGLQSTGDSRFCMMWTGLHVPAINVPGFAGSHGLPIGLTLIAPRYEDEQLLQVAKLVAEVFVGADQGRLNKVPAPEGVMHLKL